MEAGKLRIRTETREKQTQNTHLHIGVLENEVIATKKRGDDDCGVDVKVPMYTLAIRVATWSPIRKIRGFPFLVFTGGTEMGTANATF